MESGSFVGQVEPLKVSFDEVGRALTKLSQATGKLVHMV